MKKNILKVMEKLEIDEGIKPLIGQMWKHEYVTLFSCEGDNNPKAYVVIKKVGDGWFEKNALRYGLKKAENSSCCDEQKELIIEEIKKYGFDPKKFVDKRNFCSNCGAGVNGNIVYNGKLRLPFIQSVKSLENN